MIGVSKLAILCGQGREGRGRFEEGPKTAGKEEGALTRQQGCNEHLLPDKRN